MNRLVLLFISSLFANPSPGLTLFSPIISMPEEGTVFETYLVDNNQNTINTWYSDYCVAHTSYMIEDTILVRPGRISPPFFDAGGIGGIIQKYNWQGDVIWETMWANNQYQQHHDIEILPNGNILLISFDRKTQEEVINKGKVAHNGDFWSETIFEIRPIGTNEYEIVWEWSLFDHLIQDVNPDLENYASIANSPNKLDINYMAQNDEGPLPPQFYNPDFLHLNAIDYHEDLDLIVVSSRRSNEIYIIDHSTTIEEAASDSGGNYGKGGGFLYRWGNPMVYNRGTLEDQKLFAPHGVNWVNGTLDHLIIFNNGHQRPVEDNNDIPYSSIEEIVTPFIPSEGYLIEEDLAYGPIDYYWYYSDNVSYSNIQSGAYRLENGNTLITYTTLSKIVEVANDLEIVWQYDTDQTEYFSRALRYNGITELGDVNYDFSINILDVVSTANMVLNFDNYNYIVDMNSDDVINILDIISIINIIIDN